MLSNPENAVHNPLGANEARLKELLAKHIDYSIDSILFRLNGDIRNLAESQRRITEVEEQMRDGIHPH